MNAIARFWRDPAMPHVESRRACDSRACYRPHAHPTFSIGAVDAGTSVFTGAPGGPVALQPGTLVFVPPHRVHACNPAPDCAWSYQMLHIDAQWMRAALHDDTRTSHICGEDAPVRLLREQTAYGAFCKLNALLFSDAEVDEKDSALIEFLGDRDHDVGQTIDQPSDAATHRQRIAPLLDATDETPLALRLSLADMAERIGLSQYQTIRAFRAATGFTPHAWQLNERVNLARAGLRAGEPLAELAYRLGFADQSHFNRVFKSLTASAPGQYRR